MPSTFARNLGHVVLGIGLAGAVACSSGRGPSPGAAEVGEPVPSVGRVVVTMSSALPADRRSRLEAVDGPSRLARAVEAELRRAGRIAPQSSRVLTLEVTKYRMRSGATVFWAGLMAGGDFLEVAATVTEGDRTVRSFTTGAGTSGAFAGLDQVSRFEKVTGAVAQRVVKAL